MTYVFEAEDGSQVERQFSVKDCPPAVEVNGVRYRKIICAPFIYIGEKHKASNTMARSEEVAHQEAGFFDVNPYSGKSMADMVMTGEGVTKDMDGTRKMLDDRGYDVSRIGKETPKPMPSEDPERYSALGN